MFKKIWNCKNPRWRPPPSWEIEKSPYLGRSSSDFDVPNFVEIAQTATEICSILCWIGFKMPIHAPFWGVLGHIPPNDVTHRPSPKKDHPWAEPRHSSHKPRKSVARFELGVGTTKKDRTGQEKVTKGLYFTYLRRSPHWSDVHENLCSGWCSRRYHVCQVSKWNFRGLRFCRVSNFPFSYWFLNGPYNSAALLRCLW